MNIEFQVVWKTKALIPNNDPEYRKNSKLFNVRTGNSFLRKIGGNLKSFFMPTVLEPTNIFHQAIHKTKSNLGFKGKKFPYEWYDDVNEVSRRVNFNIHLYGSRIIILTIRLDPVNLNDNFLDVLRLQEINSYPNLFKLTKEILGLIISGDHHNFSSSNSPKIYPCTAIRSFHGDQVLSDEQAVEVVTHHSDVNNQVIEDMLSKNRNHQVDESSLLIDRQGIFTQIPLKTHDDSGPFRRYYSACNMLEMAVAIFSLVETGNISTLSEDERNSIFELVSEPKRMLTNSTSSRNIWQLLISEFNLAEHLQSQKMKYLKAKTIAHVIEEPWYKKPIGIIFLGLVITIVGSLILGWL